MVNLHRNGSVWDRNERIRQNDNWETIEQGLSRLDSVVAESQTTLDEAVRVNSKNTETNERLDNIIADSGTSSTEVVDARGDFTVLSERLDEKEQNFSAQLTQNEAEIKQKEADLKTTLTVKSEKIRPVITFIDDDSHMDVWERLKPISESKGVPFCTAVITGRFNHSSHMDETQIKQLHGMGWEIMGHTYSHPTGGAGGLLNYSGDEERLEYELNSGCKALLNDIVGDEVRGFVYPQNADDVEIRRITKQHYDYAFGNVDVNKEGTLDTMSLNRVAFGSYTDGNPSVQGNGEKNSLDYYKECVDHAVENNEWLVFMSHVSAQSTDDDLILEQLIDYIKSLNVEILTAYEAYKIHGNRYFAGDLETDHTVVDKENVLKFPFRYKKGEQDGVTLNELITDFEQNTITVNTITYSHGFNNDFPEPRAGTLYTYYINTDFHRYNYQEFHSAPNGNVYRRNCADDTGESWGKWFITNVKKEDTPVIKFDSEANSNDFPIGMNIRYVSGSDDDFANFPESGYGMLISVKQNSNGYGSYQEFHRQHSRRIYKRYWDYDTESWSRFNLITTSAISTSQRSPQPYQGMSYFDTTLGKPVWCKTEAVVDSDGSVTTPAVWVDATGATVISG